MKYCKNCGMQISDDSECCVHCGEKVGSYTRVEIVDEDFTTYPEVNERSIVAAIILSIVTLGIYSIYWKWFNISFTLWIWTGSQRIKYI